MQPRGRPGARTRSGWCMRDWVGLVPVCGALPTHRVCGRACVARPLQARGRALLNLRLTDAEGGLLGRTLLTLVNNKASRQPEWLLRACACVLGRQGLSWRGGQAAATSAPTSHPPAPPSVTSAQGSGSDPLPQHKMSPHDIVRLRPSKGDGSGPPLAEGVVYRVRDAAITVAGARPRLAALVLPPRATRSLKPPPHVHPPRTPCPCTLPHTHPPNHLPTTHPTAAHPPPNSPSYPPQWRICLRRGWGCLCGWRRWPTR